MSDARKDVGMSGESVSVSMSVSGNAASSGGGDNFDGVHTTRHKLQT